MSLVIETICPICEQECREPGQLRAHIHRHHRKSELIERYLAKPR